MTEKAETPVPRTKYAAQAGLDLQQPDTQPDITQAEHELLEMIRGGTVRQVAVNCFERGRRSVFIKDHPQEKLFILGVGANFDEAWNARKPTSFATTDEERAKIEGEMAQRSKARVPRPVVTVGCIVNGAPQGVAEVYNDGRRVKRGMTAEEVAKAQSFRHCHE
jgi:hypothetical protein